ncbi:hypothetical protein [Dyella choica]|uniref:DUF2268 domain-containing protein n=1 Tax=Dyella choica TaxID=1927959 RepID=A0A432M6A2_9GAMM|nr:hypothetical protein [Dyella choica]RUL74929.1 hypothetical protein EKH80_12675 [Dyella choica]
MRSSPGRGGDVMKAISSKTVYLALLLACTLPASAAETPPIGQSFAEFWSAAAGKPFQQQEHAWNRDIEALRRDVYDTVVWEKQHDPYWQARRQMWLRARFAKYPALAADIPVEVRALQDALAKQSLRFKALFPDADAHPPVAILLAPNFDAKSGVLGNGKPILVFAADSLLLEHAQLDIVVPHELFHLYHAQHAGIRNDGVMPDVPLTVPLFEEGLATYVSGELAPGHTDGELLLEDELGAIPASRLPEIARRFLTDARNKAIDPEHPDRFQRWFNAAPKPYQQGLPNRSGYWLGLQLIRYLRHTYTLAQIAAWSPTQADAQVMAALQQISS